MAFTPPFCPNAECPNHEMQSKRIIPWYTKQGYFTSQLQGKSQRYQCKTCDLHFSNRSFQLDYFTKKKVPIQQIFFAINNGSGIRMLARQLKVNPSVIINRLQRLARQSIGLMAQLFDSKPINEDLAVDGFESFVYSQYFPNNYTIAVGNDSQVLYDVDYALFRRKGRMTKGQKAFCQKLYEQYPIESGQISQSFYRIIGTILEKWSWNQESEPKTLFTDEHRSYQNTLQDHQEWQYLHKTHQVTPSSNGINPGSYAR
jgi:IS1 family transposase